MLSKEQTLQPPPEIRYPEELPVSQRRAEIKHLIAANQVVIVCGETGSGKTTQLPKMCLELGRGLNGQSIVHTQPRRLAATATAKRIAQELNSEIGQWVGFKIRFQDQSNASTAVKLVTDGILLAESQTDPLFKKYDTIIIDEAHERSLNIDFLLGYLKDVLTKRPDLKLIVTSATIDAERFSKHFENAQGKPAPVIEVSGRLYPVEVRYKDPNDFDTSRRKNAPVNLADEVDEDAFQAATLDAVEELCREGQGDILMFLPGEREIRDMANFLSKNLRQSLEILPLFARLTAQEQERIFKPSGRRRIVLSTNVAETSLTVPGIRYVIDSGVARVKRYSYRNKVEMLQVERISKASANQRAGRCGRVANGVCIRLYAEADFAGRTDYTDPEILRSSLASVILRMKSLHLTEVEDFPFLQRPMGRAIADGYQLLSELNALDDAGHLTKTGRALAKLPLDPRIARMLFEASQRGCLNELLVLAAALSIQDPRDRPIDAKEAADNAQQQFDDAESDFMSFLKLWNYFIDLKQQNLTNRDMKNALQRKFLSANRLREWSEVHQQLTAMVKDQKWTLNATPATYDQIHLALMAGLLGNIGLKHETDPVYLGARSIKFSVHPGSNLFKKGGKWIMAAELVETTRLYARSVAKIQPEWIEKVGAHLVKRNHNNPHWEKGSGQAVALETGTIYGLPIYSQRRVSLARFNQADARRLMIHEGLVPGQVKTTVPFYVHNRKLVEDLEKLEHKARRQDILVDEALIAQFYDDKLPAGVYNQQTLENWAKQASKEDLAALYLNKEDLLSKKAGDITTEFYPKKLEMGGLAFDLTYHFEPGSPRDGVTLTIPLMLLNQVNPGRTEWLVPGMLKEKALLLLKSLPQKLRRHCVPVPQFAEKFAQAHFDSNLYEKPLLERLRDFVASETPARPLLSDFRIETLPPHHFMNFKLIDEHGRQLDMQRSLSALKAEWGRKAQESFKSSDVVEQVRAQVGGQAGIASPASETRKLSPNPAKSSSGSNSTFSDQPITDWSFGSLPDMLEIKRAGQTFFGYPALKDMGEHCIIEVFDEEEIARKVHLDGVLRLFNIALKEPLKYLTKNLIDFQKVAMLYMPLGSSEELQQQWIKLTLMRSALAAGLPTTQDEFNTKAQEARSRMNLIAQEIGKVLLIILNEYSALNKKLQALSKSFPECVADIQNQLNWLLPKGFLLKKPWEQLAHYPRYLKAAQIRLERVRNSVDRDKQLMKDVMDLQLHWVRASSQLKGQEDESLSQFAWQLQELRVSLFAQELRTPMPVSVKRLQKAWETMARRQQ
ncbi:MAG: ATP-dependent RNA helicase HrpA [Limnobacter sp.]|uniref:ATP-dependent RNA helicase HrpA n=1 Tax=Limnobacter sp. TaxID=2003368 RepID=UPI0011F7CA3E|nr:ATP-dependent RNA helicase HrpA [Limnobacter sp.]MDZ4049337.1 ATP-dependent RNA helicase HrpA [Limnobacter sp.]RZO94200.1 MAG: ATP-dependent RNA helicase HrpA [Limnobacter sp.]